MSNELIPQDGSDSSDSSDRWLRLDVRGNNNQLWASLREKFVVQIKKLLSATLDHERGTTVREEAKQFTSAFLDFAKAKLAKSGLEAEKIGAEICKTFAEKQTELARAEKTAEETRQLRIKNDIAELRLTLGATKAFIMGDCSDEAIIFGKQLESFLKILKEIAAT